MRSYQESENDVFMLTRFCMLMPSWWSTLFTFFSYFIFYGGATYLFCINVK